MLEGADHRLARLGRRALPRARPRQGARAAASRRFGIDLPQSGTVFATRTVIVSLVVGTLVTLLASSVPGAPGDARRADRGRARGCAAAVASRAVRPARRARDAGASALALLLYGTLDSGASGGCACSRSASASILSFIGVALVAPRFVPPAGRCPRRSRRTARRRRRDRWRARTRCGTRRAPRRRRRR